MSIPILDTGEIKKMRAAGTAAASVLQFIEPQVQAGISTDKLNQLCHQFITQNGWLSAPLNYKGFPKSICTSINSVVCHGIPSAQDILQDGDIINIDITVIRDGYHGDTSRTFLVGVVDPKVKLLVERTEKAMLRGIDIVKPGVSFSKIGQTIEKYAQKFNYGIVRDYTGHGIGRMFHAEPTILHYDDGKPTVKMRAGMCFTIEPMINLSSSWQTVLDKKDGWTVRTADGTVSAQFEHTVLVTEKGAEILTLS